jgi:hypothetical protein
MEKSAGPRPALLIGIGYNKYMEKFSIRDAYRKSWGLWKTHWKLMVSTTAVFIVLNWLIPDENKGGNSLWLVGLIAAVINLILYLGWIKMLFKVYDHVPTRFVEIFQHAALFWKVVGVSILFGLMVVLGFILLIIPGVYFYLKYQFALFAVIDRPKIHIKEAFQESARLTEGVKWKLLGFGFINVLVIVLGAVTVIGELLTLPLATLAVIYVYRHLHAKKEAKDGHSLHASTA